MPNTTIRALGIGCGLALLALPAAALEFNFDPEPGMDQQAIDGFEAAGALWSARFDDPATVNIDIGFRSLDPGVLAETGSQRVTVDYQDYLDALAGDRTSADDAAAGPNLQPGPAFRMLLNRTSNSPLGSGSAGPFLDDDGDANNDRVRLTRATAKALGLVAAADPGLDAQITFSSDFNWDFDPGDGTRANHFNFVLVAAHEIGHMLGFTSGVDILDGNSPPVNGPFADVQFTFVSGKDLFRFSDDSVDQDAGVLDWTADTRAKYFSVDGGATDLGGFSTGRTFGDGRQASHWKDDRGLGIMDPTVGAGESPQITALDLRLFDVIGWDLAGAPPAPRRADLSIATGTTVDVTYTLTATNLGPDGVTGAVIDDDFPPGVTGVTWQCAAAGGATCTASGSGDVHDTVDLPAGGRVTYAATGTAASAGVRTATVAPPGGVEDPVPGNNGGG